jgi:RNA polymerase sigma-70 factor (ECF subfamily)
MTKAGTETNWNDLELVAGLKQRDQEAVGVFFNQYANRIYNYAYYHSGNHHLAEDIVSETMMRVIEKIPGYEWREIPFKAWVFRIARNLLVDYFRRRDKRNETSLDSAPDWDGAGDAGAADGGDLASQLSMRQDLQEAIARLPEEQRTVFLLRFVEDLELEQVANLLDRTLPAIKSLQYRAVQNLRKALGEPGKEGGSVSGMKTGKRGRP